jgi:peptidoglycan hydrolase CwlO-like protein
LDKKEIESLVRRLREDLDNTKQDRKEKDLKLDESNQLIAKLQG